MTRRLIVATVLGTFAIAAVAVAAHGHKISEKVLGAASIAQPYTIQADQPDVVVARAVVPPGASFGWQAIRSRSHAKDVHRSGRKSAVSRVERD